MSRSSAPQPAYAPYARCIRVRTAGGAQAYIFENSWKSKSAKTVQVPLHTLLQGPVFCVPSLHTRTNCAKAVRARSRSAGQGYGELKTLSREPSLRTVCKGCLNTRHKSRARLRNLLFAYVINIPARASMAPTTRTTAGSSFSKSRWDGYRAS